MARLGFTIAVAWHCLIVTLENIPEARILFGSGDRACSSRLSGTEEGGNALQAVSIQS
jgi:hypothetical protein